MVDTSGALGLPASGPAVNVITIAEAETVVVQSALTAVFFQQYGKTKGFLRRKCKKGTQLRTNLSDWQYSGIHLPTGNRLDFCCHRR